MKRAERKKLEERYLNDTAVSPAARVNYLASKYMDMPMLVVMGAATVASGGITAAGYIESRTETATIQFQIAAIPPRIENLGERHHNLNTNNVDKENSERRDLENAVRRVLSHGADDIRGLTLVFSKTGNQVTLLDKQARTSFEHAVDPEALSVAYKEKRQETQDTAMDMNSSLLKIGGGLTAGLSFFTLWLLRLRQERINIVLKHYQIK